MLTALNNEGYHTKQNSYHNHRLQTYDTSQNESPLSQPIFPSVIISITYYKT